MSGSDDMHGAAPLRSSDAERADVLAYLARRRANCALVAERSPEFADDATVMRRQLEVLIDEVRGGLHEGVAAMAPLQAEA